MTQRRQLRLMALIVLTGLLTACSPASAARKTRTTEAVRPTTSSTKHPEASSAPNTSASTTAVWTEITPHAAFPTSYNFPVYVERDRMWAFHPQGIWSSADGKSWEKAKLPTIRHSVYETTYVQFNHAVYALGKNQGNYLDLRFGSAIRRTTDFQTWELLAQSSNLPNRVFHGTVVFDGKIWLLGGFDGRNHHNDVWHSSDGVHWTQATAHAAWTPRQVDKCVVFQNRIWVIGGDVIDGLPTSNPRAAQEIWSSADGVNWTLVTEQVQLSGNSPVVFDGKLWLVGANRDGTFARASQITTDGIHWQEAPAPWTPRGGVATWIFDGKLFMTGGKYSVTENGQIRFIYSNDVWALTPTRS